MKKLLLLLILLSSTISSAHQIVNSTDFLVGGGTVITILPTQNFNNNISVSDTSNYLNFSINGSFVNFTTSDSRTVSNISYSGDNFNFTNLGTGNLNFTTKMSNSNAVYNLSVDGVIVDNVTSGVNGLVIANYTFDVAQHNVSIAQLGVVTPTLTPTATVVSGGGGGGNPPYQTPINPPLVSVEVLNLTPSSVLLGLSIKNEGTQAVEYVYSWKLVKLNILGIETEELKNWTASKYLKEGEMAKIPIPFENLNTSKYSFDVTVVYQGYTSKAQVTFAIQPEQQLITQATSLILGWGGYLISLLILLAILYYVRKSAMERIKRPPIPPAQQH